MNATPKSATKTFISKIVDKNYKEANAELHKLVEIKLAERIRASVTEKK
jgi:hypothetical protein